MAKKHFDEAGETRTRWDDIVVMDQEDAVKLDAYKETARKWLQYGDMRDKFICGAETLRDRLIRYDCTCLAMGLNHVKQFKSAAALARLHKLSPARITALIKQFQDERGLMPMPGQNTDEQREEKSKARRNTFK